MSDIADKFNQLRRIISNRFIEIGHATQSINYYIDGIILYILTNDKSNIDLSIFDTEIKSNSSLSDNYFNEYDNLIFDIVHYTAKESDSYNKSVIFTKYVYSTCRIMDAIEMVNIELTITIDRLKKMIDILNTEQDLDIIELCNDLLNELQQIENDNKKIITDKNTLLFLSLI